MRRLLIILPFILFYCQHEMVVPSELCPDDIKELIRQDSLEILERFDRVQRGDFFRDNLDVLFNLDYPSPFLSNVDSIYIDSVRITSEHLNNTWYDYYEFQVRKNKVDYATHPIFWPYEFQFTFFVMKAPDQKTPIYLYSTEDIQLFSRVIRRVDRNPFKFATFTFHHTREDFYRPYTAKIGRSNVATY